MYRHLVISLVAAFVLAGYTFPQIPPEIVECFKKPAQEVQACINKEK